MTRLRQHGLALDRATANVEVARWLREVANARVHAETGAVPAVRLEEERSALQRLPAPYRADVAAARPRAATAAVVPAHSVTVVPPQHALAIYDRLLEAA